MYIGPMNYGIGMISIDSDRRDDPRGFWLYGVMNAATLALCVYLIAFPR